MARTPTAAQVLGHVVLVTGKEEYLSARTVAAVRDAVRAHDPDAELAESAASDLLAGLSAAGMRVWRTDTSGDVVVVVREGRVGVVARH